MRILVAAIVLGMLVGVPGARAGEFDADHLLSAPLNFENDAPRKISPTPEIRNAVFAGVKQVLVAYAGPAVQMEEMSVFTETGVITTTCGFIRLNGVRRPYVMQVDRRGLVYFKVDPPRTHVQAAGCLRPVSTVSIYP